MGVQRVLETLVLRSGGVRLRSGWSSITELLSRAPKADSPSQRLRCAP